MSFSLYVGSSYNWLAVATTGQMRESVFFQVPSLGASLAYSHSRPATCVNLPWASRYQRYVMNRVKLRRSETPTRTHPVTEKLADIPRAYSFPSGHSCVPFG
ncbi:uncharacterized protein UMAG_04728 [Mycosarcoma maydis]|uniref:Uncharacterized protein n=1 Tax=Mycosarcoma maydis TaxID=5270 RepID=A0A0D1BXL4_MYCMD|nr:uncharacterized protein UMAG_04728 [Ustilago maydis 521]KIS66667.1 hypothetical protein UMAG_04728 [Ustilago maydis 521]|eukprot:XP_011391612.1 hypothetical protein UMAG_04728 [Ustilago maydis 521]